MNISEIKRKIPRRFTSSSTALEVVQGKDLSGRVALITGCSTGIGLEMARSLATVNCEIIFACIGKCETLKVIEGISRECKDKRKLNFIQVDLSSMQSCVRFCEEVKQQYQHIDYLILNAAIFAIPHTLTVDGLEMIFQVCHLSHFFIATTLSPLLDSDSRVVVVSSSWHKLAKLPRRGLTRETLSVDSDRYNAMMAYKNAKLCNVLFALELSRRWQSRDISVFAVHPGSLIYTKIQRHSLFYRFAFYVGKPLTRSPQKAAATGVYCATAEELSGVSGLYFSGCCVCKPSKKSRDESLGRELWSLSEEIIEDALSGIKFN